LAYGGLCVISSISGCLGFIDELTDGNFPANVIVADYTQLHKTCDSIKELLGIDQEQRDEIERRVSSQVAKEILDRLALNEDQTEKLMRDGWELAQQMSWDSVCQMYFLPALERAYHNRRIRQIA